jgi:hypothetical protein
VIIQKTGLHQYLKYLGLVVGHPFLEEAQELRTAAATRIERKRRAVFFMLGVWDQ